MRMEIDGNTNDFSSPCSISSDLFSPYCLSSMFYLFQGEDKINNFGTKHTVDLSNPGEDSINHGSLNNLVRCSIRKLWTSYILRIVLSFFLWIWTNGKYRESGWFSYFAKMLWCVWKYSIVELFISVGLNTLFIIELFRIFSW